MADLSSFLGAAGIGGAIGKAIVSLELETTKYQTELKAAQAQTVAGTNTMSSGFSKFGGLASTALLGVGAAAVAFGAVSVKAAIEANDAHLKLQNTFENNAALADSSVAAFERQAASLRDLTGVDDEAIISGQALLGQFKLTGAQVLELTPLIVDLSAKMGIDLEAASKAVGKATEGNTGALARYIGKIETGATPLETFTNITDKLGRVQGFAADRADAEPWRVLGAALEEVAETVGQQLLPVIQDLAQILTDNVPIIQAVIGKFEVLVDIYKDVATISFVPWEVAGDTFGELGGKIEELNVQFPELQRNLEANQAKAALVTAGFHDLTSGAIKAGNAVEGAGKDAHGAEIDFADLTLALDETAEQTKITRREFLDSTRVMQREARQLADALKEIAKEDWVNPKYVEFLSKQGPEWLIGFANLTEEQQHKAQQAWRDSTRELDNARDSQDKMIGALDKLDKSTTKHTVEIEYRYVGFDPSKPGMSGSAQQR